MENKVSISYAIAVWNEHLELSTLLKRITKNLSPDDEIVIQGDQGNVTDEVVSVVASALKSSQVSYVEFPLKKDFAGFKNNLIKNCKKDYIFLIDPDEIPHPKFIQNIKPLLIANPEFDLLYVPRVNIVLGITKDYIVSQRWTVERLIIPKMDYDTKEILALYNIKEKDAWKGDLWVEAINPFDYQSRIFKNLSTIRYTNKVHEVITGATTPTVLPVSLENFKENDYSWCLFHVKSFDRQKSQNNFYEQL